MTGLTTLRGKDSKEAARVLAAISSSLLPQPGIVEAPSQSGLDSGLLKSVLGEIRQRLRVSEDDFSIKTQSKIYAFVSSEITKAAFANTSEKKIKDRLGNKGELRPNQYQVVMGEKSTKIIEALGNKRYHILEAITHPDDVVHLQGSYTGDDKDIRPTISIKSVPGKTPDDDFILLIISFREGQTQEVYTALRVYRSDVDVRGSSNPLDVLRAFAHTYGLKFQLGNTVSRYLENEIIGVHPFDGSHIELQYEMKPLEGLMGNRYYPVLAAVETRVQAPHSETTTARVLFAFLVDISKYTMTMRRHKVQLTSEEQWKFPTI